MTDYILWSVLLFLLYSPLNQGLKQGAGSLTIPRRKVFTLQSIKSRIETEPIDLEAGNDTGFLLYSPLNQGLKQKLGMKDIPDEWVFTLQSIKSRIETKT